MKRALVVGVLVLSSACIDFDAKLDAGLARPDSGSPPRRHTACTFDASVTADCPGFTSDGGWCWVNPTPMGEDLLSLLYQADDDVWIGGVAGTLMHGARGPDGGFLWTDFKRTDHLSFDYNSSAKIVGFLPQSDGGVLAYGPSMPVLALSGCEWIPLPDPPTGLVFSAAQLPNDAIRFVGQKNDHTYEFDITSAGRGAERQGDPGFASSVLAIDGGFVTSFAFANKEHHVIGNGLDALLDLPANPYSDVPLWEGPGGALWYGGDDCTVGTVSPPRSAPAVHPCANRDLGVSILAGASSAALGKQVVVGTHATVLEADDLLTASALPNLFDTVVPSAEPSLTAVSFLPNGAGLVVGTGAYIASRHRLRWAPEQIRLRSQLRGSVALLDGGLLLVGDDRVVVAPRTDGSPPTIVSGGTEANSDDLFAAWTDGTTFIAAGNNGSQSGALYFDHQRMPRATFPGTELRSVVGSAVNNLVVTGTHGYVSALGVDGGWFTQPFDAGNRTDVEFTSQVWTKQNQVYMGAATDTTTPDGGHVFGGLVATLAGGVHTVFTTDAGVNALATVDGVLFAVGDATLLLQWPLDGGQPATKSPLCSTPCRTARLSGVAARSATDAWAVGGDGVAFHFDGTDWTPVETGTRRYLNGVIITADANGHHWLWLYGEYGTILRKQLD